MHACVGRSSHVGLSTTAWSIVSIAIALSGGRIFMHAGI